MAIRVQRAFVVAMAEGPRSGRAGAEVGASPDCPAVLGLAARRATHCAPCGRSVQTSATSQFTKRASRAAARPALLGSAQARPDRGPSAMASDGGGYPSSRTSVVAVRDGHSGAGSLWGGEKRRPMVGARSALRHLTRRACLSAAPAGRVASCATRPSGEHRSGVGRSTDRPSVSLPRNAQHALRATATERGLHEAWHAGLTLNHIPDTP